jgi:hypothetical protein
MPKTFKETVTKIPPLKQLDVAVAFTKLALPIWDDYAKVESNLTFTEEGPWPVLHTVDKNLLRDTIEAVEEFLKLDRHVIPQVGNAKLSGLDDLFFKPMVCLQWMEWELPDPVCKTFYAVHNLLNFILNDAKNQEGESTIFVSINQSVDALTSSKKMTFDEVFNIIENISQKEWNTFDPSSPST